MHFAHAHIHVEHGGMRGGVSTIQKFTEDKNFPLRKFPAIRYVNRSEKNDHTTQVQLCPPNTRQLGKLNSDDGIAGT